MRNAKRELPPGTGTDGLPVPSAAPTEPASVLVARLGGFFTGVGWLFVIPAVTIGIGSTWWPDLVTPGLTFTALVTLGGPIALLFHPRTRRFGGFMLVGMAVTGLVLVGVVLAFALLLAYASVH